MVDLIEPHPDPQVEALAQRIFSINPDTQPWNGDAFSWRDARNRSGHRRAKAIETAEALVADGWSQADSTRPAEKPKPTDVADRLRAFAKQYTEDPTRLLSAATFAADVHDLTDDLTREDSPLLAAFFPKDTATKSMWRLLGETLDQATARPAMPPTAAPPMATPEERPEETGLVDLLQRIEQQITGLPDPYVLAKDAIPAWRIGRDDAARIVREAIAAERG